MYILLFEILCNLKIKMLPRFLGNTNFYMQFILCLYIGDELVLLFLNRNDYINKIRVLVHNQVVFRDFEVLKF